MKRPEDMPYEVFKEVRSDMNKALKVRKRGTVAWASKEKGTAKKFTKK